MRNKKISAGFITSDRTGFSLLEILVTIGVLVTLAALVTLSRGAIARSLELSRCASNLRQIGIATLHYGNDHGGLLPGPMVATQRATYSLSDLSDPHHLSHFLVSYLQYPTPRPGESLVAGLFECPAFKKAHRNVTVPKCYKHEGTALSDVIEQRPFGYRAAGAKTIPPMKMHNVVGLSETIALIDSVGTEGAGEVHGSGRNVLFIDGHVESIHPDRLLKQSSFIRIR